MSVAEEFISKFHAIDGATVGDRQKNLFKLLSSYSSLQTNTEALDAISATLTPQNYLESLFKLDFLIYFKRTAEVLNYLKDGNDVYVSKIAKQAVWLFKDTFNKISADELINQILPNMSFCVRSKILTKLSRYSSDERFDLIFDAIVARYGLFIASNYLLGCSAAKIKSILKNYKINTLSSVHLKVLYEKDRDLIRNYFFDFSRLDHNKQRKFFIFLYSQDLALLEELETKFKFKVHLGRRNTKKFVEAHKDDVIKKPSNYLGQINMKVVLRKLGKESEVLIKNTLPEKIKDIRLHTFDNHFQRILQIIPQKYLYKTYFHVIQNHYNQKYADNPELIYEDLIKLIKDPKERAALAKIKVDESSSNFQLYVPYLSCEEAIPLIKDKINVTSHIHERSTLVELLLKNCSINEDHKSLLQVLKYFYARHKNDDKSVILNFINGISRHFKLHELDEEIWSTIKEIMAVYSLKYENNSEGLVQQAPSRPKKKRIATNAKVFGSAFCALPANMLMMRRAVPKVIVYGNSDDQLIAYMEFMFRNDKLKDDTVLDFLYNKTLQFHVRDDFNHEFMKHLFKVALENSTQIAEKRKVSKLQYHCDLISVLEQRHYKKDLKMSLFDYPSLVESFYESVQSAEHVPWIIREHFRKKLFTLEDNPYKSKNMQIYWSDRHKHFYDQFDIQWFLKYSPQILIDNFDKALVDILAILQVPNYRRGKRTKIAPKKKFIITWIKKFSHLKLDERITSHCREILQDPTADKIAHIRCLSILLSTEQYIELADSYKPTSRKINLKNEQAVKIYNIQFTIAENFKYTNDYKVLDSLLNYCAGDFLQYALTSFSSLLYRTPENQLGKYLQFLHDNKAVSVRKHCLFFTRQLCDASVIERAFTDAAENEKDASLQRRIFGSLINHFLKSPQTIYFDMLKSNIVFIKEDDSELLNEIMKCIDKMPPRYKAPFIACIWEHLEKTVIKPQSLLSLQASLLRYVDMKVAADFDLSLALRIIGETLQQDHKVITQYDIAIFAFNILISKNEKKQILDALFGIINNDPKLTWLYSKFVRNILKLKPNENIDFLQDYLDYWRPKIDPVDNFKGFIELFFLQLKFEFHTLTSVEPISQKIAEFCDKIIADYGPYVLKVFTTIFQELLCFFTTDKVTDYDFYYSMISNNPSTAVVTMIIDILPQKSLYPEKVQGYTKILDKINSFKDPAIKINAKAKFAPDESLISPFSGGVLYTPWQIPSQFN